MASPWVATIASVAVISLLSFAGAAALVLRPETLRRSLLVLISFAAGGLLGDAFLHLIPEVVEAEGGLKPATAVAIIGGLVAFFLLEKALHWHHAHLGSNEVMHPVAVTNLVGDGLHNFVDGAVVAGAFVASRPLGVATALAVALHEIPQEIGDLGILLHAGLKPRRALALNFLTGLSSLLGAVVTLLVSGAAKGVELVLLPLTAGGFVYIAATDLMPELHKEPEIGKSLLQVGALLAGVGLMSLLLLLE